MEKSLRPGMGTPMKMPVRVRMRKIQRPILSAHLKLCAQGASSDLYITMIATTPTNAMDMRTELWRATLIARAPAHIHHASG